MEMQANAILPTPPSAHLEIFLRVQMSLPVLAIMPFSSIILTYFHTISFLGKYFKAYKTVTS